MAANEERVKKLDKLIQREEYYSDLQLKLRKLEIMFDEKQKRVIELEKLVAAYEKDLEDRMEKS